MEVVLTTHAKRRLRQRTSLRNVQAHKRMIEKLLAEKELVPGAEGQFFLWHENMSYVFQKDYKNNRLVLVTAVDRSTGKDECDHDEVSEHIRKRRKERSKTRKKRYPNKR